jgi:hypothetical protein
MTHPRLTAVFCCLLSLLALGAKGVPTTDEIRQMLDDKQYKRVLREVARAMALKGDDAIGYDRGKLLLIRADAQLAMRQELSAAKSYREAADAATNADDRSTARAAALLIARGDHLVYRPRTGERIGRDMDIVTERTPAFAALLADELSSLEPRVSAAKEKKSIAEVLETVKAIEPVADVEFVATGGRTRTDELRGSFVTRMETLLDEALVELDRQADAIEANAMGLIALPKAAKAGQAPAKGLAF